MQITRRSIISGVIRTMDLPVTEDQMAAWRSGVLAQNAFPQLSAGQREFIMTGITDEEWDDTFKPEDEE